MYTGIRTVALLAVLLGLAGAKLTCDNPTKGSATTKSTVLKMCKACRALTSNTFNEKPLYPKGKVDVKRDPQKKCDAEGKFKNHYVMDNDAGAETPEQRKTFIEAMCFCGQYGHTFDQCQADCTQAHSERRGNSGHWFRDDNGKMAPFQNVCKPGGGTTGKFDGVTNGDGLDVSTRRALGALGEANKLKEKGSDETWEETCRSINCCDDGALVEMSVVKQEDLDKKADEKREAVLAALNADSIVNGRVKYDKLANFEEVCSKVNEFSMPRIRALTKALLGKQETTSTKAKEALEASGLCASKAARFRASKASRLLRAN